MKRKVLFAALISLMLSALPAAGLFALSEKKEIELGREEHGKIIARYGVYRDKDLQEYITMVGERVAKESSRPDLQYHFTILNDEIINAFALPGGYVYITRGMLTHVNSESELAAILGHEVAHIHRKTCASKTDQAEGVKYSQYGCGDRHRAAGSL